MSDEHQMTCFNISAAFVITRAMPTAAELGYGFHHGWLTRADVVAVALAKYEAGVPLRAAEEELALLLSDDLERVDDLVAELEIAGESSERRARFWLFLALAWLLEHRDDADDPFEVVEMLFADFDFPEEIQGLVRFMPAGPGGVPSLENIERNWPAYVDRLTTEYRQRDLAGTE